MMTAMLMGVVIGILVVVVPLFLIGAKRLKGSNSVEHVSENVVTVLRKEP